MEREAIRLPENCAVRLIDLDLTVDGLLAVDETGFVNIYINARLSRAAQLKALRHELRHYERGDLYTGEDIRTVERRAEQPSEPALLAVDGSPLPAAAVLRPRDLHPVGQGLYLPTGESGRRVTADLGALETRLSEAFGVFDVLQTPPLFPVGRLRVLSEGLCLEDVAFLAFQPAMRQSALPAVLQLYRAPNDRLRGAVYYDPRGRMDNALITAEAREGVVVRFDLRRPRPGSGLRLCRILREAEGQVRTVF